MDYREQKIKQFEEETGWRGTNPRELPLRPTGEHSTWDWYYKAFNEWLLSQLQQSEKNIELFKKDEQLTFEASLETQQRIKQLESLLQQREKQLKEATSRDWLDNKYPS